MEPSDEEGETGWKLVHGDVFRPPSHPMALSVLIGSGVQIIGMTVITMGIVSVYIPCVMLTFLVSICCVGFPLSCATRNACYCFCGSFRYNGVCL